jgi:hypothetical protein
LSDDVELSAAVLAGLLADDDRRSVAAALILGASSLDAVLAATNLDGRRVAKAVTRLVNAGLVEWGPDDTLHLLGAAFGAAARAAAASAAEADAVIDADVSAESARVLRAFVHDGRLQSIPTTRSKRLVILDLLAQEFEPGRHYSEPMVNLMLGRWYPDTAALRRYLVDEGFLDRAQGQYWRAGGSVPVEP